MQKRPPIKILLVDDSEFCRDMARLMLSPAGFTVLTIDSPLGFSKTLLQEKPDLALVDVTMPALNGRFKQKTRPVGDSVVEFASMALASTLHVRSLTSA